MSLLLAALMTTVLLMGVAVRAQDEEFDMMDPGEDYFEHDHELPEEFDEEALRRELEELGIPDFDADYHEWEGEEGEEFFAGEDEF